MIKTSEMLNTMFQDIVNNATNHGAFEMLSDSDMSVHVVIGEDEEAARYLDEYVNSGIILCLKNPGKDIYEVRDDYDSILWLAGTEEECGKFLLEIRAESRKEPANGQNQQ